MRKVVGGWVAKVGLGERIGGGGRGRQGGGGRMLALQ